MEEIIDEEVENSKNTNTAMRPEAFKTFIGQEDTVDKLKTMLASAQMRDTVIEHVLLYGPPGLGKTTIANIIANSQQGKLFTISAPTIEKPKDLIHAFTSAEKGDVIFIDEIHRLNPIIEEFIYPAMEDRRLDIIIENDSSIGEKKSITVPLEPFTLVGATTKAGALSGPLRSRFNITNKLILYTQEELKHIILNNQKFLNIKIDEDAASLIAKASRGTPRIANNITKWCRDCAVVNHEHINLNVTKNALKRADIEEDGLTKQDVELLVVLQEKFKGGPVGISTLATTLGEDTTSIEEINEPYMIHSNYIKRSLSGRVLTEQGYKRIQHLLNSNPLV